jgi:predicted RNase H-like HicB family nuclease
MTYDVLVTRKANKFIARVRQWPVIVVEGESEAEVLRQAQADLQALLAGGRIIQLQLDAKPEAHPWQLFAGMFADDPDWEAFQEAVQRYREETDRTGAEE